MPRAPWQSRQAAESAVASLPNVRTSAGSPESRCLATSPWHEAQPVVPPPTSNALTRACGVPAKAPASSS